jgi:TATA-binding protein-associated factor
VADGAAAAHRVLIFALSNESLQLIERLLSERLPACRYVRLEHGTKPIELQSLVTRFNRDPTIDAMLLLTDMGAHGLNLTGADTVIFFEHHWNPAVDDQASNRPHRIGQTRTVTVYRLITRDTIEQRIHSLQQFKLRIANAVVNADNSNIAVDLNTNQLLDLYPAATSAAKSGSAPSTTTAAARSALDPTHGASDLVQLESEAQYDEFSVKRVRR